MTPQLLVTLSPDGGLCVELPGAFATRRKLELNVDTAGEVLKRILLAQGAERGERGRRGDLIGNDSAPTESQLEHWESHGVWPDAHCQWCLAEGRVHGREPRVRRAVVVLKRNDGIEVRKIPERFKGKGRGQVAKVRVEGTGL